MTLLTSAAPHLLGTDLVDMGGDGAYELIMPELAGGYQGAGSLPLYWYSIFRVEDSIPKEVSASYPAFYVDRLLQYVGLIQSLADQVAPGSIIAVEAQAKARFLKAKYDRRIVGDRTAGIDDAIRWASADNPTLEMLAIESFRDINGPKAIAELKKLSQAKDYAVAQAAANALQGMTSAR
jgi:hypothetical protein